MKVFKGNILTVNAANDVARFLVEDGGRIVFVGDELPGEFLKAPMEDLGGKPYAKQKGGLLPNVIKLRHC